jgi:hypothetical protein
MDRERTRRPEDEDVASEPPPNQGGIGSSEHGGKDSSELVPDDDRGRIAREKEGGRRDDAGSKTERR